MKKIILVPITVALLSSGCVIPDSDLIKDIKIPDFNFSLAYTPDLIEGNVFTKLQISKVVPGLSYSEVVEIMGSPVIRDPFHGYRLDYINRSKIGGNVSMYRATVFFNKYTELVDKVQLVGDIPG